MVVGHLSKVLDPDAEPLSNRVVGHHTFDAAFGVKVTRPYELILKVLGMNLAPGN